RAAGPPPADPPREPDHRHPWRSGRLREDELPGVERLRVAARRAGLEPPEPQHGQEQIAREPPAVALRREAGEKMRDLPLAERRVQRHEEVRRPEVALVLRDLVLEDRVIAEGLPGELRDQAVVLVLVGAVVREDEVRRLAGLQVLEPFL